MLVLSRKSHEKVYIGDDIVVEVVDIRGDKVRLGFHAPVTVPVHREETYRAIKEKQLDARAGDPCPNCQSKNTRTSSLWPGSLICQDCGEFKHP
jgi:carbon storage regulator